MSLGEAQVTCATKKSFLHHSPARCLRSKLSLGEFLVLRLLDTWHICPCCFYHPWLKPHPEAFQLSVGT